MFRLDRKKINVSFELWIYNYTYFVAETIIGIINTHDRRRHSCAAAHAPRSIFIFVRSTIANIIIYNISHCIYSRIVHLYTYTVCTRYIRGIYMVYAYNYIYGRAPGAGVIDTDKDYYKKERVSGCRSAVQ